jgi:hypothetical protein
MDHKLSPLPYHVDCPNERATQRTGEGRRDMDGEGGRAGVEEREGEGVVAGAAAGEKAEEGEKGEEGQGQGQQEKCRASFLKSLYLVTLLSKCIWAL